MPHLRSVASVMKHFAMGKQVRFYIMLGYSGPDGRDPNQSRLVKFDSVSGKNVSFIRLTRNMQQIQEKRSYNIEQIVRDGGFLAIDKDGKNHILFIMAEAAGDTEAAGCAEDVVGDTGN